MRLEHLAVLILLATAVVCCGCDGHQETLGEMFERIADEHDAEADEWQEKLNDGWGVIDGLRFDLATLMVKENRDIATKIRAELHPALINPLPPDPEPTPDEDDGMHSVLKKECDPCP